MATDEFSKFADILSEALSQHHLSGFEIAPLDGILSPPLGSLTMGYFLGFHSPCIFGS